MKQIKLDDSTHARLQSYAGKGRTLDRAINDLLDECLQKTIDKEAIKRYPGLTPQTIGDFLVSAVRGRVATQFREMEKK